MEDFTFYFSPRTQFLDQSDGFWIRPRAHGGKRRQETRVACVVRFGGIIGAMAVIKFATRKIQNSVREAMNSSRLDDSRT